MRHHSVEDPVDGRAELVVGWVVGQVARLPDLSDHPLDPGEHLACHRTVAPRLGHDGVENNGSARFGRDALGEGATGAGLVSTVGAV